MLEGSCQCGAVRWTYEGQTRSATACNCTACRRYGSLWIYGYEGEGVSIHADSDAHRGYERPGGVLAFHFCLTCGAVTHWRGRKPGPDGRRRIAVNVRLSEPETVSAIPLQRFDGLGTFEDLPPDGRCVADMWF